MRILLLSLTLILASCGVEEDSSGNTTPEATPPTKDEPVTDNKNGSDQPFCQVQKLFDDNCLKCHSDGGNKPTLTQASTATDLVDKKNNKGDFYVKSGSPDESEVYLRISHNEVSKRMPKGGPALSQEDIALVKTWIEDGAPTTCP